MKKQVKMFALGAISAFLAVGIAAGVYAACAGRLIAVPAEDIEICHMGRTIFSRGGQELFWFQDSLYVPLEPMAKFFGMGVFWNGETKTAEVDVLSDATEVDGYVPLADIHPERAKETVVKAQTAEAAETDAVDAKGLLAPDGEGGAFLISQVKDASGAEDVRIQKMKKNGTVAAEKLYGGTNFDFVYNAKYQKGLGLVLQGRSQSYDGAFAGTQNSGFLALVNPETLELGWLFTPPPGDNLDTVLAAAGDGVFYFANHNQGEKSYIGKVDRAGKQVWQSDFSPAYVPCMAALKDNSLVFFDNHHSTQEGSYLARTGQEGSISQKLAMDSCRNIVPTDDGGFFTVQVRNIKTVPQPAYISSIWFDTETVVTKFDADFKIAWRKTYDSVKDGLGEDKVYPQPDGTVWVADGK